MNDDQDKQDNSTYLYQTLGSLENENCQLVSEIVNDENSSVVSPSEVLEHSDLIAKLETILADQTDKAISHLENIVPSDEQASEKGLGQLCVHNDTLFVTVIEKYRELHVLRWDAEHGTFQIFQPIAGLMDMGYNFFPGAIDGKHLVSTGYGDAGHTWWSYYLLDPDAITSDLVERCSGSYQTDDDGKFTDQYLLECTREYQPAAE